MIGLANRVLDVVPLYVEIAFEAFPLFRGQFCRRYFQEFLGIVVDVGGNNYSALAYCFQAFHQGLIEDSVVTVFFFRNHGDQIRMSH